MVPGLYPVASATKNVRVKKKEKKGGCRERINRRRCDENKMSILISKATESNDTQNEYFAKRAMSQTENVLKNTTPVLWQTTNVSLLSDRLKQPQISLKLLFLRKLEEHSQFEPTRQRIRYLCISCTTENRIQNNVTTGSP